jgi:hypothetical protein
VIVKSVITASFESFGAVITLQFVRYGQTLKSLELYREPHNKKSTGKQYA